jgi:hypothetical protein
MTARTTIGKIALLMFVLNLGFVPNAGAKLDAEGCRYPVSVDYGAPLERMPPVHRPHNGEERPPFAPRGLMLRIATPRLVVGRGEIGFELSPQAMSVGKLNWTVVSRLNRVRRDGRVAKVLGTRRLKVGELNADLDFTFGISGHPSFYRVDIRFLGASGKPLGSYAEYFGVLKHRTRYRQSVSPQVIREGERLITRTENLGTTPLYMGVGFTIDRFDEGMWKLDPATPQGFPDVRIGLFGGVTYECQSLRLPASMAPGHYRFRKEVEVMSGQRRTIAADFFVLS